MQIMFTTTEQLKTSFGMELPPKTILGVIILVRTQMWLFHNQTVPRQGGTPPNHVDVKVLIIPSLFHATPLKITAAKLQL